MTNVETLVGGTGDDTITVTTQLVNGSVDLGDGTDSLSLSSAANSATISNVESLLGGSGADTITLGAIASNATIDLYSGSDKLTSATSPTWRPSPTSRRWPVARVQTRITLGSALSAANSIDLGAGNDTLTLGDFTNTGSVTNVETLVGGASNDTVTVTTLLSKGSINLGDGTDKVTLSSAANVVTISNVESIVGGSGNDTVTLGSELVSTDSSI